MSFYVTVTPTIQNVEVIVDADLKEYVDQAEVFADQAEASAISADNSADSALASATSATASANSASSSASSASSSASTATTQAGIATTKANEASQSASNALASEQASAISEANALASEQASAQSEANALSSEQNALASEQASALSASNALASENSASASASTATTQAGIATTQAGISTTQASNALASANAAAASAASAAQVGTSTLLTGFSVGSNTTIAGTDSILQAFNKTQGQINARVSSNIYSANGTLAGARTLTLGGFSLDFIGAVTSRFFANGNIGIGTTTDAGFRLDVAGSTRIVPPANTTGLTLSGYSLTGSDATSAVNISGTWNTTGTPSLILANVTDTASNASSLLMDLRVGNSTRLGVLKSGSIWFGNNFSYIIPTGTAQSDSRLSIRSGQGGNVGNIALLQLSTNNAITSTSTNPILVTIDSIFSPTSGTATYSNLRINSIINQTGGANGTTRGLFVNPTLTSAADWRSIEWSNNTEWGLYGTGTANNYFGGSLGIGNTSLSGYNLRVDKQITGLTTSTGIASIGTIQSDVTSNARMFTSFANTQATSFTLPNLSHYQAQQGSFGLNSVVTNQFGFIAEANIIGATNNFGFRGEIPSGTGRWNLYMNGTASNYLRGNLLLNTTTDAGFLLDVNGTARVTGNLTTNLTATRIPFIETGGVLSDDAGLTWDNTNKRLLIAQTNLGGQTTNLNLINLSTTSSTAIALKFTPSTDVNTQIGAAIKVIRTNSPSNGDCQMIFSVYSPISTLLNDYWRILSSGVLESIGTQTIQTSTGNLTIATNGGNGNIALLPNGTGGVGVGTSSPNSVAQLEVSSTTKGFLPPRMTTAQRDLIAAVAGLVIYNTTTNKHQGHNGTAWQDFY